MKKTTVCRLCLWVLTVFWGGVIWYLSLQSAPQSAALSSGLTKQLLECFEAFTSLPESEQVSVLAQVQSWMRELAHIAEYGVLGLLTALLVHSYRPVRFVDLSFVATAVFSIVDECLQQFVSVGRAFQVIDLLKDWFGSLLGIGFIWFVLWAVKRIHYRGSCYGDA